MSILSNYVLKKTPKLAAKETQALQKPAGTPWI